MEVEFDVKMTKNALLDYMLHHAYSGPSAIIGTVLGAGILVVAATGRGGVLFVIAGLFAIIYYPWTIYLQAVKQMKLTPAFQKPLHYKMTADGLEVSQGEEIQSQKWEDMVKAVSTANSIILYTSKVNASIFPKKDLEEKLPVVIQCISTYMPPKKVKIRG